MNPTRPARRARARTRGIAPESTRLAPLVALAVTSAAALALAPPARAADTIDTSAGPVSVETLATLEHPWGLAYLPDGRLLVTEKVGHLRVFADGELSAPIEGVPAVVFEGQGGLLDVAIDPAFDENGLVYLAYVERADEQPDFDTFDADPRLGPWINEDDTTRKGLAVARGTLVGDRFEGVETIWRQAPKTIGLGHFGGRLVFAPDGALIITSGERQRFEPAQDVSVNLGKIARILPDGSMPSDNPWASVGEMADDVYSLGHRNPLGAAIHPDSGELWIHEMGPQGGDELNRVEPGVNYGWPNASNGSHYNEVAIPHHVLKPEYKAPAYYWHPAISPSGMAFYEGDLFGEGWQGSLFIGGLSAKTLVRVSFADGRHEGEERLALNRRVRDVEIAPDGAVIVIGDGPGAPLLRLTPAEGGDGS